MISTDVDDIAKVLLHHGHEAGTFREVLVTMVMGNDHQPFDTIWNLSSAKFQLALSDIDRVPRGVVNLVNVYRPAGKTGWILPSALLETAIRLLYDRYDWATEWRTISTVAAALAWARPPSFDGINIERPGAKKAEDVLREYIRNPYAINACADGKHRT